MKYFIEFSQFSAEDDVVLAMPSGRMGRHERNTRHWIEWKGDRSSTSSFYPAITLVNAASLHWRQLRCVVNACAADIIVRSRKAWLGAMPKKALHWKNHRVTWVDTTPMPAGIWS